MIPITRPYSLWNLKNYLEMTQSQLRVKQKCLSCVKSNVKTTKMNFERCSANKLSKITIANPSNLLLVCPSASPPFPFVMLLILFSFSFFEWLFLCFTQFGDSSYCLNLDKLRDTAPFSFPTCTSFKTSLNDSSK